MSNVCTNMQMIKFNLSFDFGLREKCQSLLTVGVSKTRGRGLFFLHHRSFVGQIRIKANIKKLSLLG